MHKWLVGVDEAGRGPLAGPVAVAAFATVTSFRSRTPKWMKGVRDSKKLSEKQREEWYEKFCELERKGKILFACSLVSAGVIDKLGIVAAIRLGIARSLSRLNLESRFNLDNVTVRLDGLLKAPPQYKNQSTIIHGDDIEPIISAASIIAKVTRDRLMQRLAKKYPLYSFEIHKGYGTKAHYKALKKHGPSPIHRRSFLF